MSAELPAFKRVVVISDLHLPPTARLGNFRAGNELAAWTAAQAAAADGGSALVLAGDIIDMLLIDQRPLDLDLATAATLTETALKRLESHNSWMGDWCAGLRSWLARGARIVLLPGNHDLEWLHPDAAAEFVRWTTGRPDHPAVQIWREGKPWECRVGDWHTVVGHGHRGDAINDLDPKQIDAALRAGRKSISLPPGSELVLGPVLAFKRALDPITNRSRFPFIDAVKPEAPGVLLLLLYLDPLLLLKNLPASLVPLLKSLKRAVSRELFGGSALAMPAAPLSDSGSADEGTALDDPTARPIRPTDDLAAQMADALVSALSDSERHAPEGTLAHLESYLESGQSLSPVEKTMSASGGIRRAMLRAWLRREHAVSEAFFQRHEASEFDRRIIDEHLPENSGPRVVIVGHTHIAREVQLAKDRVYLNTGTWTRLLDLSQFDDSDENLDALIDVLESGNVPSFPRLTWAEVTPNGPSLHFHMPGNGI
jgi:UDP-2,3-diacylglucosamine pyrophosphatase LpxH